MRRAWQSAAAKLMRAAETGASADIEAATKQWNWRFCSTAGYIRSSHGTRSRELSRSIAPAISENSPSVVIATSYRPARSSLVPIRDLLLSAGSRGFRGPLRFPGNPGSRSILGR